MFSDEEMSDFLLRHQLPSHFRDIARDYYLPLVRQLFEKHVDSQSLLIGINGAQGTGKSTLAGFIQVAAESTFNWNVAVLSIDDFYLTREERISHARNLHPLLMTRGVPGTHDTEMLAACLASLQALESGQHLAIPRFDKAIDDRSDESEWTTTVGPVDLIILEGWCVGSETQPESELEKPINTLEREQDPDGIWRKYVNQQLGSSYRQIFEQLHLLIHISAPNFESILRWRLKQERKLAEISTSDATGLMNEEQIVRFMQFYERLTRANQVTVANNADIVFNMDDKHTIISVAHGDEDESNH